MVLRKCAPEKEKEIRIIFEKQPFGELERLVTRKLLDVVKKVAKEELESEKWLQLVAELNGRSYEEMRVIVLEFLDMDVFNISVENCISFLNPLIDSWDIDLTNFAMEIVLNRRLAPGYLKKLEFVEKEPDAAVRGRVWTHRIPSGPFPEWQCQRGRNRVPKETEIQRVSAYSALLLP